MNFEEIISIILNAICTIIIFFLYWLQKNKFKNTGPSVINKMIEDEYKRWYLYNSAYITSKDFSIHGFNKILYEFKIRLLRKGFKKNILKNIFLFYRKLIIVGIFQYIIYY